jgi:hypothetical protein
LEFRTDPESEHIAPKLKDLIAKQMEELEACGSRGEQVAYLQLRLFYLMLREIYFDLYYDVAVFEPKTLQSRNNFSLYERQMLTFMEQIIVKDNSEFEQRQME